MNEERKFISPQGSSERITGQGRGWSNLGYAPEVATPGFASRMAKELRTRRSLDSTRKFPIGQDKYIHTGTIPNVRLKGRVKPIVSARCSHTTPLMPLSGSSFSSGFLASSSNRMHELSSVVSELGSLPPVPESIKDPTSVKNVVAALQQTQSAKTGIKRFRYLEPDETNKKQRVCSPTGQASANSQPTITVTSISSNVGEKRALDISSNGSLDGLHISPENKRRCIPDPRQASLSSATNSHSRRHKMSGRETPFSLYDSQGGSDDSESNKSMYSHQSEQSLRDQVMENSFRIPTDQSGSLTPASTRGSAPSGVDTQCSSRTTTPTKASQALNLDNYRADKAKNRQRLSRMLGMLFNTSDDEETAGVSESALKSINIMNKLLQNNDNCLLSSADSLSDKGPKSDNVSASYTFKLPPSSSAVSKSVTVSLNSKSEVAVSSLVASASTSESSKESKELTTNVLKQGPMGNAPITVTQSVASSILSSISSSLAPINTSDCSPSGIDVLTSTTRVLSSPSVVRQLSFSSTGPVSTGNVAASTSPTASVFNSLLSGFKTTSSGSISAITNKVPSNPESSATTSTTTTSIASITDFSLMKNSNTLPVFSQEHNPLTSTTKPASIIKTIDTLTTKSSLAEKQSEGTLSGPFVFGSTSNQDLITEIFNKPSTLNTQNEHKEFTFRTIGEPKSTTAESMPTSIPFKTQSFTFSPPAVTVSSSTSSVATDAPLKFGSVSNFSFSGKGPAITPSVDKAAQFSFPQKSVLSDTSEATNSAASSDLFNFQSKSSFVGKTSSEASTVVPKFGMPASSAGSLFDTAKTSSFSISTGNKPSVFSLSPMKSDTEPDDANAKPSSLFTFKSSENSKISELKLPESSPFAAAIKPILEFGSSAPSSFPNVSTSFTAGKVSTAFAPTNSLSDNNKFSFGPTTKTDSLSDSKKFSFGQTTKTDSKLFNFGTATSTSVPTIPQFGSGNTSNPFQFGGSSVNSIPQFGASSVSSVPQFGTSNVSSGPQFAATSVNSVTQFGSSSVSSLPQFGASSTSSIPQFGAPTVTSTTTQFGTNSRETAKPQFDSTASATSIPQFGSTASTTSISQFGSTAGAISIPQFGATNGTPQFGATTPLPQFGSTNVSNQLFGASTYPSFSPGAFNFGNSSVGVGSDNLFSIGAGAATSSVARRPRTRTARRK